VEGGPPTMVFPVLTESGISPLALAGMPTGSVWFCPTCTTGGLARNVADGCDSHAENGDVPAALEVATLYVAVAVAAAPLMARLPTAALIWV
jgi:hypothetical protein